MIYKSQEGRALKRMTVYFESREQDGKEKPESFTGFPDKKS